MEERELGGDESFQTTWMFNTQVHCSKTQIKKIKYDFFVPEVM